MASTQTQLLMSSSRTAMASHVSSCPSLTLHKFSSHPLLKQAPLVSKRKLVSKRRLVRATIATPGSPHPITSPHLKTPHSPYKRHGHGPPPEIGPLVRGDGFDKKLLNFFGDGPGKEKKNEGEEREVEDLRKSIENYGELAQTTYDTMVSKNASNPQFGKVILDLPEKKFLTWPHQTFTNGQAENYEVHAYLYAYAGAYQLVRAAGQGNYVGHVSTRKSRGSANEKEVVVSWRGTITKDEWLQDGKALMVNWNGGFPLAKYPQAVTKDQFSAGLQLVGKGALISIIVAIAYGLAVHDFSLGDAMNVILRLLNQDKTVGEIFNLLFNWPLDSRVLWPTFFIATFLLPLLASSDPPTSPDGFPPKTGQSQRSIALGLGSLMVDWTLFGLTTWAKTQLLTYVSPSVHYGFKQSYTEASDGREPPRLTVLKTLNKILQDNPDGRISIVATGHSLGGALASLNAFDMAELVRNCDAEEDEGAFCFEQYHQKTLEEVRQFKKLVRKRKPGSVTVTAVTWESPRVGNNMFSKRFGPDESSGVPAEPVGQSVWMRTVRTLLFEVVYAISGGVAALDPEIANVALMATVAALGFGLSLLLNAPAINYGILSVVAATVILRAYGRLFLLKSEGGGGEKAGDSETLRGLRIRNLSDVVPVVPWGVLSLQWYRHGGYELVGNVYDIKEYAGTSTWPIQLRILFFSFVYNVTMPWANIGARHNLEAMLKMINRERDFALMNKSDDILSQECKIPAVWFDPLVNQGLVKNADGKYRYPSNSHNVPFFGRHGHAADHHDEKE